MNPARKQYWTAQIFYHKRPQKGHCLELDFDDKPEAIREVLQWRELGFTVKLNTGTDLPLFFRDPRDEDPFDKEIIIMEPAKRGRKAKYI